MRFRAILLSRGRTATGIQVPNEVVKGLSASRRPAVRVTINGYTFRSTVAPLGGRLMLPVSAEVRQHAGVAAGDDLEIEIELDTELRELIVLPDFTAALDRDADARRVFDGLSYSHKRRYVLSIDGANSADTRQRRIDQAISQLVG